ncbi:glycosyltransferase [Franconibacter helveticus 513]|uniref:glycosyltransferase n=1 Tax=Franconibacter helveticus TaxID=357240 RepID=UPI000467683E|nr:glycosyltransferase [Franconibacter helveticus]
MIHFILVSHGHDDYILNLLKGIGVLNSQDYKFYIKDNLGSSALKNYCFEREIPYFFSGVPKGFSANNNEIVNYLRNNNFVKQGDYYIFLNPDVIITEKSIMELVYIHKQNKYDLFSIDLYTDEKYINRDPSIRSFPKIGDFISSFLFNVNKSVVDRSKITQPTKVDWFAGSFIAIKCNVFEAIGGFDESYFMYCEDLDLCLRAHKKGFKAYYLPSIKAIHFTQHQNRNILNRHLVWHIKSIFLLYFKNFRYLNKYSR